MLSTISFHSSSLQRSREGRIPTWQMPRSVFNHTREPTYWISQIHPTEIRTTDRNMVVPYLLSGAAPDTLWPTALYHGYVDFSSSLATWRLCFLPNQTDGQHLKFDQYSFHLRYQLFVERRVVNGCGELIPLPTQL